MRGELLEQTGVVKQHDRFKVVKKVGEVGTKIPKHNHPDELILFTVVKGKVEVLLDECETYLVEPGKVLHFDGNHFIQAEFIEAGEVFVTLIQKAGGTE